MIQLLKKDLNIAAVIYFGRQLGTSSEFYIQRNLVNLILFCSCGDDCVITQKRNAVLKTICVITQKELEHIFYLKSYSVIQ